MSDRIRVVDLEVWTQIGVPDEERAHAQKLLVTAELIVDPFSAAAATDDIAKTVDYFAVAGRIKSLAAEKPRRLLETLAEELAADLLKSFAIKELNLEIKKFILPDARYVSVEVLRSCGGR